jgi:nitrate reductase gamma subunit
MSESLHFAATLSHVALLVMGTIYFFRIRWILSFKAGKERQAPTGKGTTDPKASIWYSIANVIMPWAMESTRHKWVLYLQFVIFHLGVIAAIGLTFIIPYMPGLLAVPGMVGLLQAVTGGACIVGVIRIIRRVGSVYIRAISSPDDYFSLLLLTVWFFFAYLSVPMDTSGGEGHMMTFFHMTTFFLVYVPFSKISHYLYYPFTRFFLGKTMGRRGVWPASHAS